MANFLQIAETITVGNSKTITMFGGGPPPGNNRLALFDDAPDIVDIADKTPPRRGPYYDWTITGKLPGKTMIRAYIPGSKNEYTLPMELTINGRINIRFSANGEGTLECVGLGTFRILGDPSKRYPTDITVDPTAPKSSIKERVHRSKEYNVDMPYAVKIWGQLGIYIHEFPDNLQENGGSPSKGCIHVGKGNAEQVYNYVVTRTRIRIKYPW
ncbi:MAG: L,D-transpeptidase [Pyrinomonadaceae bacterium]